MTDEIDDNLAAILDQSRTRLVMSGSKFVPIVTDTLRQALNVAVDYGDQVVAIHSPTGAIRLDGAHIGSVARGSASITKHQLDVP